LDNLDQKNGGQYTKLEKLAKVHVEGKSETKGQKDNTKND